MYPLLVETTAWLLLRTKRGQLALLLVVAGVAARYHLTPLASLTPQQLVVGEEAHQPLTPWWPQQPAQHTPENQVSKHDSWQQ